MIRRAGMPCALLLALGGCAAADGLAPAWTDLPPLYVRHTVALPVVAAPGVMPRFGEGPP